ncbi:hypothetical protein [Paraburkholderia diazotrophica]|uniref:Uncharacterized protein n=1 Tax=Paraburkholderia diazotrophica TaxID=667676 RepID=A0A1H6RFI7_9BURK|nr:hypothetical protein [Paraburkholderia diazotrophica]SEI52064.1 hypothetical protein SAMN05192539_1002146 [Paraburkholderia diazotrophica]
MRTLEQQLLTLREQYQLSRSAGKAHEAIKDCSEIFSRLKPVIDALSMSIKNQSVLEALPENAPERVDFDNELQRLRDHAASNLSRFTQAWTSQKSEARQDDSLNAVTDSLRHLSLSIDQHLQSCWTNWIESLRGTFIVEQVILDTQRDIPGLEQSYTRYIELRKQFKLLSSQIPDAVSSLSDLQSIARAMRAEREGMKFDLPPEVDAFFKRLNQHDGAGKVPLSEMSPKIFDWLREQGLLANFSIERSRKLYQ